MFHILQRIWIRCTFDGCLSNLPYGVKSTLYDDDLVISYSSRQVNTIERVLQGAIKKLENLCTKRRFSFSAAITVDLLICRWRNYPKTPHHFTLNIETTLGKDEHTCLGLNVYNILRRNALSGKKFVVVFFNTFSISM